MNLPFLRPSDYYAKMVKIDSHTEKIKGRLLVEKRRMEEAEERRKARDNKKKAKEGVSPWDRSGGKGKGKEQKGGNGKRKSREFIDSKYGFGGKKGMKKQNTTEITND
ncbi:hypothetical protein L1887_16811 [Cichorium endivia]|nr:hypothetical protein L1887_16811 [Cichorium endivia]